MNHKVLIGIVFIFIIGIISVSGYFIVIKNNENRNMKENDTNHILDNEKEEEENMNPNSKVAVIYFSATGTTKTVAEYIQETTNGNLIEIVPKNKYTDSDLSYNNNNSRANKEQNDNTSRPELANPIDVSSYDTIYLGYPIWWEDVPKIILSFLDNHDLSGKTVIPFCTSGGSSISTSMNTLRNYDKDIHWLEGRRFTTSSQKEIRNWIENNMNS